MTTPRPAPQRSPGVTAAPAPAVALAATAARAIHHPLTQARENLGREP